MPSWKAFLLRLCALCLTAHPFQGLFFFWGKGRNGKGVLLRLLESHSGAFIRGSLPTR